MSRQLDHGSQRSAVSLVALLLSCAGGVWLVVAGVRHRAAR